MIRQNQRIRLFEDIDDRIQHISDIYAEIQNVLHNNPEKVFASLRRIGKFIHIISGYYYIRSESERINNYFTLSSLEMVAAALSKLHIKWYIGLESALELQKVTWQVTPHITIINELFSKKVKINNTYVIFRKMKPLLIKNYKRKQTPQGICLNYSVIEKTIIDLVYYKRRVPAEAFEQVNLEKLQSMVKGFPLSIQNKVKHETI